MRHAYTAGGESGSNRVMAFGIVHNVVYDWGRESLSGGAS